MDELIAYISSSYIFPAVIFIVMFGLGAALDLSMLRNTLARPRALFVGLAGQLLLLPVLAFLVASIGSWPPFIAIALVIISLCPGGSTSNAIVFSIRGDLELSVSLTAITSVITLVTIPLLLSLVFQLMGTGESDISLPMAQIMKSLAIMMALPISLGVLLRKLSKPLAEATVPPLRRLSLILILMIIALSIYNARTYVDGAYLTILLASLIQALVILPSSLLLGKVARLPLKQQLVIAIEVGLQNSVIAIYIGTSLLQRPDLSVVAITYGVINYLLIGIMIYLFRRFRSDAFS